MQVFLITKANIDTFFFKGTESSTCRIVKSLPLRTIQRACNNSEGFQGDSVVNNLPANAGDQSLSPGSGRSPRDGNGNPLQYFCLGNTMDRGTWYATIYGVPKSQT